MGAALRTRTVVQSLITLTCKLVATARFEGHEKDLKDFFLTFLAELAHQIELGPAASDSDYVLFQHSVNANVRGGARIRHEILLRKLFSLAPSLANVFDPSIIKESGVTGRIANLSDSIVNLVDQLNKKHALKEGEDLFKATNKTAQAMLRIRKPVTTFAKYKDFIDDLYFLFRESLGSRLDGNWPSALADVNILRTDIRHDVDHGDAAKIRSKRKKIGSVFEKYVGEKGPETLDPTKFPIVQANLLGAIEGDLRVLLAKS